jgi:hypothetical protein
VHASDPVAAAIEDLQLTLGEGPCVDVATSGAAVMVADLSDRPGDLRDRWPVFLNEASTLGVQALFAFPIRVGDTALGVVDLYRVSPGPLSRSQLSSTVSTVDTLGQHIVDNEDRTNGGAAPTYSLVVHQAAGIVMVQLDSSIEEALVRLRASAYAEGRPLADLATDIVRGTVTFREERR